MKLYQSACNMPDNAKTITAGFDGLDIGCLNKILWGRYYFDTFIDKAKKGEIFKGNKILNKNSGKIGFDTFRLKLVESNLTLIPFLHDFDEVLG